jgi:cell division protein ZapA
MRSREGEPDLDNHDLSLKNDGVTVEIYDQAYHLRGHDPEYIAELAAMVDTKMRAVAAQGTTVDSLRVAVLAALNIADQFLTLQGRHQALAGSVTEAETSIRNRTTSLTGLLDSVLTAERRAG